MGHTSGVLVMDDRPYHTRFVAATSGAGLVFAAPDDDILDAHDLELHVPEESLEIEPRAAIAQVTTLGRSSAGKRGLAIQSLDELRWEAYHNDSSQAGMGIMVVEAVRISGDVVDGSDLELGNPFSADQPKLCAAIDASRAADAIGWQTGTTPEQPRVVGVDPLGVHVRGVFVVHRLWFDERAQSPAEAIDLARATMEAAP